MERIMTKPNPTFDLTVEDVDQIERALAGQVEVLSQARLSLSEENPAHLSKIRAITEELHGLQDLRGRLHAQKNFYRPRRGVYVGG